MNTKTNFEVSQENSQKIQGQTDWAAVNALTDEEIIAAALSDPDAQPLTEEQLLEFRRVSDVPGNTIIEKMRFLASETKNKQLLSIRYDKDVVAFFKAKGKGYQRLMNKVLRNYMEEHPAP